MNEKVHKAMTDGVSPDELESVLSEPFSDERETKPDAPAKDFAEIRRDQVFAAIDSERIYQELKWGTLADHPQSVGAYLTLMRVHLTAAEAAWAGATGDANALDRLRQVLAIGVACGEQHGMPARNLAASDVFYPD